jgi:hypothetical protein
MGIRSFLFGKRECDWCGKAIPFGSESRQKYLDAEFCSLPCLIKFGNEWADLQDRVEQKNTTTHNININDRNKYLK